MHQGEADTRSGPQRHGKGSHMTPESAAAAAVPPHVLMLGVFKQENVPFKWMDPAFTFSCFSYYVPHGTCGRNIATCTPPKPQRNTPISPCCNFQKYPRIHLIKSPISCPTRKAQSSSFKGQESKVLRRSTSVPGEERHTAGKDQQIDVKDFSIVLERKRLVGSLRRSLSLSPTKQMSSQGNLEGFSSPVSKELPDRCPVSPGSSHVRETNGSCLSYFIVIPL